MCCLTSPIHFHLFTWLTIDMHGCFGLLSELTVMQAELCVHQGHFASTAAFFAILVPQQAEGHTAFGHLTVYLFVVGALA